LQKFNSSNTNIFTTALFNGKTRQDRRLPRTVILKVNLLAMSDSISPLSSHLATLLPSTSRQQLRTSIIPALLSSITSIASTLRATQQVSYASTSNTFGDDQLALDIATDDIIRSAIKKCPAIVTASSEEDPVEKAVHGDAGNKTGSGNDQKNEEYTLAFDPLDGSSIIPANWTVGTIFSIWDGSSALHAPPSTKQIGAILGVLGPRTSAIVALRDPSSSLPELAQGTCFEVGLDASFTSADDIPVLRTDIRYTPHEKVKTRYFAPANLRTASENPAYMALISHFIAQRYTLRYAGGLVPDVVHALVKGHGVYVSPVSESSPAKLRRLYELCPVALVVECCGGRAVDAATGEDVLVRDIEGVDERGGVVFGTRSEVGMVAQKLDLAPGR
jgi:sedoheptulose-bisphosphatase